MNRSRAVVVVLLALLGLTGSVLSRQDARTAEPLGTASYADLQAFIQDYAYVVAVFTSTDPEFATWSNSLRIETSRARDTLLREAPHFDSRFKFVEVTDFTSEDVAKVVEEMGQQPPHDGRSGFTAVWRDGAVRLYQGQPQAMYLANWLLTLETTVLLKPITTKSARKALMAQENVRVVGYFKSQDPTADPDLAVFERVAKHYHLDIEFSVVTDAAFAKYFKLKYKGDVTILKPSERQIIWSSPSTFQTNNLSNSSDGAEQAGAPDVEDEDLDDQDSVQSWTYETLDQWVRQNRKALWSEISVPSMYSNWFSTFPKVLYVVPSKDGLAHSEPVVKGFSAFKSLSKQYARNVGLEFLLVDASVFTQIPQALEISTEDLPALVAFKESKRIAEHVLKLPKEEASKELYQTLKDFIDGYLKTIASEQHET